MLPPLGACPVFPFGICYWYRSLQPLSHIVFSLDHKADKVQLSIGIVEPDRTGKVKVQVTR